MNLLGEFVGKIASALFPGARAIVTKAVDRVVVAVRSAGREFVNAWMKAAEVNGAPSPETAAKAHRTEAKNLAEEERYLAEKFKRDKTRSSADADRIQEINESREKLRKEIGETNAIQSAQDITNASDLVSAEASPDELATQVGILSTKQCSCGGIMTLQFDANSKNTGQKFKWCCTAVRPLPCRNVYVTAKELAHQVSVRQPNSDLDINATQRNSWKNPSLLAKTAGRVRGHLGDEDQAILCPIHLMPLKLLQTANSSGLLLDTYQYTCLGVHADGKACNHTVPVKSFGQVSGLLSRAEGRGII